MKKYSYKRSNKRRERGKRVKKITDFQWKYKNLIVLVISIVFAGYILKSEFIFTYINSLGSTGYLGALVVGFAFSYGMTTIPAAATFYVMGNSLNPFILALIAATGAVLSDYLIYIYIKHGLLKEMRTASRKLNIDFSLRRKMMKHKSLRKITPVICGIILASPLPGSAGAALFASMDYDTKMFVYYSALLNFLGIFVIALAGAL